MAHFYCAFASSLNLSSSPFVVIMLKRITSFFFVCFFSISPFVYHRGNKIRRVWNNMKVSNQTDFYFEYTVKSPFEAATVYKLLVSLHTLDVEVV